MRFILGFIGAVFAGVLLISMISGVSEWVTNPPAPLGSKPRPGSTATATAE